ncbi:hypothetical protein QTO34_005704 [Cnephaeus nilssonii]|uniref:Gamma-tubulin complex component n=1 Tax=Cnephaeus nilssonii TaxID=3371016 RepID=A0AA40LID1_CNENI|nr:hypothetical protein QTO34_005704 [Eptesicus nilssonii]
MVSFLRPVLKQIIMAGKSMQLLKHLQVGDSTMCQATARDAGRKGLYSLFLESVQSRLRHGEEARTQPLTKQQAARGTLIRMQSIAERHLELDDAHDPLLAVNFARLYLEQSDFHEKFAGGEVCMARSSESVTCQTFELTLRSCLYPHIDKQYLDCCGDLMQTLKTDYRLVEYLQAMRNFFLMEGGDTMYDFYTSIFDKIREKETWQNVSFLNVQLQEAVGQRYPEDSSRPKSGEPVYLPESIKQAKELDLAGLGLQPLFSLSFEEEELQQLRLVGQHQAVPLTGNHL